MGVVSPKGGPFVREAMAILPLTLAGDWLCQHPRKKKKVREDFSFLPSALTWGHTLYILFFLRNLSIPFEAAICVLMPI